MDSIALLSQEGGPFLLRWIHLLGGITWIGLLYYFNLVQVPFFAETEAPVRSSAVIKLVPRALWWFRWGAVVTFVSGVLIVGWRFFQLGAAAVDTSWWLAISVGGLLGTLMFLNVWLVIWPNQQIVIASTHTVAHGGAADPRAADAGAKAFVASRTNTLFSVPMLFFMAAASHLTLFGTPARSVWIPIGIATVIALAIEANVIFGKRNVGVSKVLETHLNTLYAGGGLALVLYLVLDLLV